MKWNFAIPAACAALLAVSPACPPPAHADPVPDAYDVVVYGGTAGGVAAAVQASRMGKRVALIEPTQHLGGMTTGGLSFTDTGWGSAIGGFAGDFYRRLGRAYGKTGREYLFEPKVATGLIESVVREASVDVIRGERLDLNAGVTRDGTRITAIHMESGRTFNAGVFIDATYEGDLMAGAGVSYHVGRESNATYGERFNGVQKSNAWSHQIVAPVDPYRIPGDPASGLLPGVSAEPPGVDGQGDHRIQAYNFRLILTDNPDNRRPWTAPEGYDPARYELLARYIESANLQQVNGKVLKISPIGHGKYDLNNQGGVSTDHIGANYDYPEGDYERRQEIIEDHRRYQQGLLYFLATDERVPESMREEMNRYGLTYDEFTDTDGWSHQLYIREARRMIGEYVMTEHEVMGKRGVDDPVGLASYTMDSHNTQRYVNAGGLAKNEGDIQVGVPHPYGVSYRSLTPDRDEVTNLIVPVALSSSHIAYGSMRMEPVFMILGQSAGTAAVQALNGDGVVQHVDYERLATRLREDGQRLRWGGFGVPRPVRGDTDRGFQLRPRREPHRYGQLRARRMGRSLGPGSVLRQR